MTYSNTEFTDVGFEIPAAAPRRIKVIVSPMTDLRAPFLTFCRNCVPKIRPPSCSRSGRERPGLCRLRALCKVQRDTVGHQGQESIGLVGKQQQAERQRRAGKAWCWCCGLTMYSGGVVKYHRDVRCHGQKH